MKSEEMSSSTPTSFLAMQVYAPVSSYRTLPMCSSLPLAAESAVLRVACLAGTPAHALPILFAGLLRVLGLKLSPKAGLRAANIPDTRPGRARTADMT